MDIGGGGCTPPDRSDSDAVSTSCDNGGGLRGGTEEAEGGGLPEAENDDDGDDATAADWPPTGTLTLALGLKGCAVGQNTGVGPGDSELKLFALVDAAGAIGLASAGWNAADVVAKPEDAAA